MTTLTDAQLTVIAAANAQFVAVASWGIPLLLAEIARLRAMLHNRDIALEIYRMGQEHDERMEIRLLGLPPLADDDED